MALDRSFHALAPVGRDTSRPTGAFVGLLRRLAEMLEQAGLLRRLAEMLEQARQRRVLAELTDDQLRDIGLSRDPVFGGYSPLDDRLS